MDITTIVHLIWPTVGSKYLAVCCSHCDSLLTDCVVLARLHFRDAIQSGLGMLACFCIAFFA